jgi:hypothetical protein
VGITCSEPDHGAFGERNTSHILLAEALHLMPWLRDLDLESGQIAELGADGKWTRGKFSYGPRELTTEERDEYYAALSEREKSP